MAAPEKYDVIIVGAGPAGLSAAARAHANKLTYVVLEKGSVANTIGYYYQYGKYVMSLPAMIPLRSDLVFEAGSREEILQSWLGYVSDCHLHININEPVSDIIKHEADLEVDDITEQETGFKVKTSKAVYAAEQVILAIGKMGNPRRLDVPGEELDHVSDRLVDPRAYVDQDILVVGGGDSAAEVALALAVQNRVTISYRSAEFYRMNDSLRGQLADKMERRELTVYFNSEVERIDKGFAHLTLPDRTVRIKANRVFVKIGAEVPRQFLERCGIAFASAESAALPVINERYETNVPGLFLIGAIGGQDLIKHALNQGYEVIEYLLGHDVEPVDEPELRQRLQPAPGTTVSEKLHTIAARVPLLTHVSRQQLRELLLTSTVHCLDQGDTVFREHDYSTTFYTIVEGSVEVSSAAHPGGKRIVLHQGEFFGEMSLLSDRRRSATITAAERVILIETPRRSMLKLISAAPSVKQRIDETYILRALQTYLCPQIGADDFRKVAAKAELTTYKKGDVILTEGQPGDAFYVIRSGSVKISKQHKAGREYVVTYLSAGQYFGEMALLEEQHARGATVTAVAKTHVIRILQADFLEFLAAHPTLREQMRQEIEKRQLEIAVVLEAPEQTTGLTRFIKHGLVESTDVLLIDETKCVRCDNCVTACAATHGGHTRLDRKHGPSFAHIHVPVACRHCEGAPCLQECPPGDAIVRDPQGVVRIDEHKCIGCGNCAKFCPYGVIFMVEAPRQKTFWERLNLLDLLPGRKSPMATEGGHREMAVKCDLCEGIAGGPSCVRNCPTGAAIRVTPEYFQQVKLR
jgi:CRP-like cAMP-binding protein/thioredoxin reductase/Fe-S-cluster-containing hydrogenase component 2